MNLSENYYGSKVKIEKGELKEVQIDNIKGEFATHSIQTKNHNVMVGYSLGGDLFYLNLKSGGKVSAIKTLEYFKVIEAQNVLSIIPSHQDSVSVDSEELNNDAIISTYQSPIILAPADCVGLCLVETNSNIIGLCHSGRSGVGLNITKTFTEEFIIQAVSRSGLKKEELNFVAVIPPHIFSDEYPHQSNGFMYANNDEPNWWFNNPDFANFKDGIYYPNIGGAVVKQFEDALKEASITNYSITASGLSTFTGEGGHSFSKNKEDNVKNYYKNLVFIGFLD